MLLKASKAAVQSIAGAERDATKAEEHSSETGMVQVGHHGSLAIFPSFPDGKVKGRSTNAATVQVDHHGSPLPFPSAPRVEGHSIAIEMVRVDHHDDPWPFPVPYPSLPCPNHDPHKPYKPTVHPSDPPLSACPSLSVVLARVPVHVVLYPGLAATEAAPSRRTLPLADLHDKARPEEDSQESLQGDVSTRPKGSYSHYWVPIPRHWQCMRVCIDCCTDCTVVEPENYGHGLVDSSDGEDDIGLDELPRG